jgi:hypothetical protein
MSSHRSPPDADQVGSLLDAETEWFFFTKEKLSPEAVRVGLLDHGLFGEKVPPCFVTKGLSVIAMEVMAGLLDETDEQKLRKSIDNAGHDYVRYEALRDINIPRHMGIPHPECYAVQALAISKHWKEITEHCNKPNPAISRVHVRHVGNGRIFEMNYKGVERFQREEDELRWRAGAQYLVEADIAACFPSIYTHCIPWALDGVSKSKKSSSLTALTGNLLDKCTQNTRDRQTNGLLIGPHASNIVSEIILTQIDAELQSKGYVKIVRHIDDYSFYADTVEEAETFIRDLGLSLRTYEMFLNERKTQILKLPRPSEENWRLVLNRFIFPTGQDVRFSVIRSYFDLALECAQVIGKATPLNYAIKTLAGRGEPRKLNGRAKRMYAQEAMNLALAFPYLAPLLDECVFIPYWHDGLKEPVAAFSTALAKLGVKKLYPDTIAQALYLALKYQVALGLSVAELAGIVQVDDCITNVLLLEYAKKQGLRKVQAAIRKRAALLKADDGRERDRQWLLIYQTWSIAELKGSGQGFLAQLKSKGFEFLAMPAMPTASTEAVPTQPPQPRDPAPMAAGAP